MIKYAVYPGIVFSKTDGRLRRVNAAELMDLYGVNPQECVVIKNLAKERRLNPDNKLIKLTTKYNGNYEIPSNG